jgi:hypothetical protein
MKKSFLKSKNTAQAAMETIIILAIAMVMLTSFLALSWSQINMNYSIQQQKIGVEALDTLKEEINDAYFLGVGTVRQAQIYMPDLVDLNKSFISQNALVLHIDGTDFVASTQTEVRGLWPNQTGSNLFTITTYDDYVSIYVDLLFFSQRTINRTINQGFEEEFLLSAKNLTAENRDYNFIIDFDHENASVSSSFENQVISFTGGEIKSIDLTLSCDNNSSGSYLGQAIFVSDTNASIPISITCVASQSKLTIFPNNKTIISGGEATSEEFLVCNNSITNYVIENAEVTGSLRNYSTFNFTGSINAGQCKTLNLNILEHPAGNFPGQLIINSGGLTATASITLDNSLDNSYFASTIDDTLDSSYYFSKYIKKNSFGNWSVTGELDYNILSGESSGKEGSDNSSELSEDFYLFDDSLVGLWHLNGDALDSSGNANDGTVSGASSTSGLFNTNAYDFDGVDNYINLGNSSSLNTEKFTASFWILPQDFSTRNNLLSKEDSANWTSAVGVDGENKVTFWINDGSWIRLNSSSNINLNEWVHVTLTYDNLIKKIYINGELDITQVAPNINLNSSTNLIIGATSNTFNYNFDGKIEEVGLWNRALSEKEIKDLYNYQAGDFKEANLVARYNFNDNLNDEINLNNATNNGATFSDGLFQTSSLDFDGVDDYVVIADNSDIDLENAWTISTWVRREGSCDSGNFSKIVSKWENYFFSTYCGSGKDNVLYGCVGTGSGHTCNSNDRDVTLPINEWHHLVFTYGEETGNAELYMDGILVHQVIAAATASSNNDLFFARPHSTSLDQQFNGKIEDVMVWDKEFSQSEVRELYLEQAGDYLDESLVARYELNGNINDSVGSNNGIINGAISAEGLWGTDAYYFDGVDDYILIGDVLDSTFVGSSAKFTISSWINLNNLEGNENIIGKSADSTFSENQRQFFLRHMDGKIDFGWYGSLDTSSYRVYRTDNNISSNNWEYILVTFDASKNLGNEVEIYINGIRQNISVAFSAGTPSSIQNGTAPLAIGAIVNSAENDYKNTFDGIIEEVTIWDKALTNFEVENLYESKKPWIDEELVAYYKFNESKDSVIFDSARVHDGTLGNNASLEDNGFWDSNAIVFDGDQDYVVIDDSDDLSFESGELSFITWVKVNSVDTTNENMFLAKADYGNNQREFGFGIPRDSSSLCETTHDGSFSFWSTNVLTSNWIGVCDPNGFEFGKWYHVAVTIKDGVGKIYVDGELANTRTGMHTSMTNGTADLYLGATSSGGTIMQELDGQLEEVKIYSRELSSKEILNDYNKFLESKFVDKNIVTTEIDVSWNNIKVNSNYDYDFGNEIESDQKKMYFDGVDDYVESNNNIDSFWNNNDSIKIEATIGTELIGTNVILSLGSDNSNGFQFVTVESSNTYRAELIVNGSVYAVNLGRQSGKYIFNINKGVPGVVVTLPDGQQVSNNLTAAVLAFRANDKLNIGRRAVLNDRYFNGVVYDVKLYSDEDNLVLEYLGSGNTNSDWEDQVGDNDGTVNGSPTVVQYGDNELINGLIGLWHLNGNMDDSSGNENNGTSVGNPTLTNGLWDSDTYDFDGSGDYFDMGDADLLDIGTGPVTVSTWVKRDSLGIDEWSGIKLGSIVGKGYLGQETGYGLNSQDAGITFQIRDGSNSANIFCDVNSVDSKWHHVVGVYNILEEQTEIYFDGKLCLTGDASSLSGVNLSNSNNFAIGSRYAGGWTYDFDGKIEEVAVWDRALSEEEIKQLYIKGTSELDLNIYSCSDSECSTKTSSIYIEDINNNEEVDISSLSSSRYLGYETYFKKIDEFVGDISKYNLNAFLEDVEISYSS